jgi:4a-hydroxytetrahydrobiopterin dehydratase
MSGRPPVLSEDELADRLATLDQWSVEAGCLHRRFTFADFSEAFAFMVRVALVAEKLDHHPNWSNAWNVVVIDITSHDEGGITDLCVEFARRIDTLG